MYMYMYIICTSYVIHPLLVQYMHIHAYTCTVPAVDGLHILR